MEESIGEKKQVPMAMSTHFMELAQKIFQSVFISCFLPLAQKHLVKMRSI